MDPKLQTGGGLQGDQGQPVDPLLLDEEQLQFKEWDQGAPHFQLQFMLNTKLADEGRYPLKAIHLTVMNLNAKLPMEVYRGTLASDKRKYQIGDREVDVMAATAVSEESAEPSGRILYVDPAGGGANGDETAFAVVDFLNGNLFVRAVGGVPGGCSLESLTGLAETVKRWNPTIVKVEKNMGHGAFVAAWTPILRKVYSGGIEEEWVSGQKELRIIDTLEPIAARGSLILDESVLSDDWPGTIAQPAHKRQLFTLMHQFCTITRDRGALVHDDRLDALASACRHFVEAIAQDQTKELARAKEAQLKQWLADPMSHTRYKNPTRRGKLANAKRRLH